MISSVRHTVGFPSRNKIFASVFRTQKHWIKSGSKFLFHFFFCIHQKQGLEVVPQPGFVSNYIQSKSTQQSSAVTPQLYGHFDKLLPYFSRSTVKFLLNQICEKNKAERDNGLSMMSLQMMEVIICSHEAVASGTAKCLQRGLWVKTRFLIWFPTEKLKKDKWNSFGRPTAA